VPPAVANQAIVGQSAIRREGQRLSRECVVRVDSVIAWPVSS
jgi:hypothetical protein